MHLHGTVEEAEAFFESRHTEVRQNDDLTEDEECDVGRRPPGGQLDG